MTHEASRPHNHNQAAITPEEFSGAAQLIHDTAKQALIEAHASNTTNPQIEKRAIINSLEPILLGEHGTVAQRTLWEAAAAATREEQTGMVISDMRVAAERSIDNVKHTADYSRKRVPRIEFLHGRIFAADDGVSATIAERLNELAADYIKPDKPQEDIESLWARDMLKLGKTAEDGAISFARTADEEVHAAYSAYRQGVTQTTSAAALIQNTVAQQKAVQENLANGEQPDTATLKAAANLGILADKIKGTIKERSAGQLSEKLTEIVQAAPTPDAMESFAANVWQFAEYANTLEGNAGEDYERKVITITQAVREDIEYQFRSLYGKVGSSDIHLKSVWALLVNTPLERLQHLDVSAQVWSQQIDAAIASVARPI